MGFPGVEQPTRLNRANPKSSRAGRSLNYSDSPKQTPQFPAQTWQQYGLTRARGQFSGFLLSRNPMKRRMLIPLILAVCAE
jgi:hypothetical protein